MLKYKIENNQCVLSEVPLPLIAPDEILIKVEAIGINRADLYQIQGSYPPIIGEENVPGLEVAGTIESVGSQVLKYKVGDKVAALLSGGGYAEYVKVKQELIINIPKEISSVVAASILETYATSYYNLIEIGNLTSGKEVLISAGASGIGSAAIQLAKLYGANVTALVSTLDKANYCTLLGADQIFVYDRDFRLEGSYDIILDMYGGEFIAQYLDVATIGAKIINIALLKNKPVELKLAKLLFKNISIIGSTLKNQSFTVKNRLLQFIEKEILPLIIQGQLKITIDSIFPYLELTKALKYLEKGQHKGKVVVTL